MKEEKNLKKEKFCLGNKKCTSSSNSFIILSSFMFEVLQKQKQYKEICLFIFYHPGLNIFISYFFI
jgi:hypothetical protein